ncbi:MAG: site-2 protease family protein [Thermodesulfovibrionales bacterium]|nr:site-2 protease family protein [Thermodesulfovibrionales bacterium]
MDAAGIIRQLAVSAPAILVAITFHEVAHGYIAYRLGDPTAKSMGRLTLNPIAHIDPIGTVIMPALLLIFTQGQFVFGYAKPVPINPYNFKNPRKDMALSAAGGPAANLALALASVLIMKFVIAPLSIFVPASVSSSVLAPLMLMFRSSVIINVVLAAFNLIPVPPLDGGRVLVGFLPRNQAHALSRVEPYGMMIVIILIATGMAEFFINPLINLFLAVLSLF